MLDQKVMKMLRESPLLKDLEEDLIVQIANSGRQVVMKGRYGRIDKSDLSRRLYFVASGEMRMLRMAPDGQEHLLQRFKAGEFFCLSALSSGHGCNNIMVSSGRVELVCWGHDTFRAFIQDNPGFHHNVLSQMAWQIEQEREMRALSRCCKADVRVAAYLLHKIKHGCCLRECLRMLDVRPLSLTAQELGIARETLSRSLQRLVKKNVISYDHGQVRVADILALEAVIEESECACQRVAG